MGTCESADKNVKRNLRNNAKTQLQKIHLKQSKEIKLLCPICEESFDKRVKKPVNICENSHTICEQCRSQIEKKFALQKKGSMTCPYCKQVCVSDIRQTNEQIYKFLDNYEEVLKRIPEERKKLFAFAVVYLPNLKKRMENNEDLNVISALRIKDKMNDEQEVFNLEVFDCLPELKKLNLRNNAIKTLDVTTVNSFTLTHLNLSKNKVEGLASLFIQNIQVFKYLRVLLLQNNSIVDLKGIEKLTLLNTLNVSFNSIKDLSLLELLQNLDELHVEFNQISQFQSLNIFKKLKVCLLLGNLFKRKDAIEMAKEQWRQLRAFSISFNEANSHENEACLDILKKVGWPYLQMVIISEEGIRKQYEDTVNQFGDNENPVLINWVHQRQYKKNMMSEEADNIQQYIKEVKVFDQIGQHIWYKVGTEDRKHFKWNQNQNKIKKIHSTESFSELQYPIQKDMKTQRFIEFYTTHYNFTVGLNNQNEENYRFDINMKDEVITNKKSQLKNNQFKNKLVEIKQRNEKQMKIVFLYDETEGILILFLDDNEIYKYDDLLHHKFTNFYIQIFERNAEIKLKQDN